jgi:hypothetical protein
MKRRCHFIFRSETLIVHVPLLCRSLTLALLWPVVIDFLSDLNDLLDAVVRRPLLNGSVLA